MPTFTMPAILIFASVALATGSLTFLFLTRGTAAERRLRQVTRAGSTASVLAEVIPLQTDVPLTGLWSDTAKILPKSPKELGRLRQRLLRAGIKHPAAPVAYSLAELLLPLALAAPPFFFLTGAPRWIGVAFAAIIGYFAPDVLVQRRIAKRKRLIENGLPDALDLLVVCIEAGSGLDQAIMKTADELAITHPLLGEELRLINTEMRAGKPRMEAFKSFAQRTKVEDVRSLVAMLVQTDRFGTSVGQALRTHSETLRQKRRQRAEEAAQKIGVKLVFPLVLCFFPALYVVLLGPAIIQFMRTMM
jgi:tight adherence protein C